MTSGESNLTRMSGPQRGAGPHPELEWRTSSSPVRRLTAAPARPERSAPPSSISRHRGSASTAESDVIEAALHRGERCWYRPDRRETVEDHVGAASLVKPLDLSFERVDGPSAQGRTINPRWVSKHLAERDDTAEPRSSIRSARLDDSASAGIETLAIRCHLGQALTGLT